MTQFSHLYNDMKPFTHRAPSVIGAAYDYESVRVEKYRYFSRKYDTTIPGGIIPPGIVVSVNT